MNPNDRKRLEALRFSPEVIAKTEEVLRVWGVEDLFATCSSCGKPCYGPDVPRRQYRRKKLPAELFWRRELFACRNSTGSVVCFPCDDFEFEYM
jgi:hypothetical protein